MKISSATFAGSSTRISGKPGRKLPEFAFIGRSNVGKSSLINMLTGNNKLARTSATPGKTQLINHFLINDSWYLVDLPGYGFAKLSQSARAELARIIREYILASPELVLLFVLVDSRHDIRGPTCWPPRWKKTARSSWKSGRNCRRCLSARLRPAPERKTFYHISKTYLQIFNVYGAQNGSFRLQGLTGLCGQGH